MSPFLERLLAENNRPENCWPNMAMRWWTLWHLTGKEVYKRKYLEFKRRADAPKCGRICRDGIVLVCCRKLARPDSLFCLSCEIAVTKGQLADAITDNDAVLIALYTEDLAKLEAQTTTQF